MPFESIVLETTMNKSFETRLRECNVTDAAHLLANLLAFSNKRIANFSSSKVLVGYLNTLNILLNRLPSSILVPPKKHAASADVKGKMKEVLIIDDSDSDDDDDIEIIQRAREKVGTTSVKDDDGDVTMQAARGPSTAQRVGARPLDELPINVDPRTYAFLTTLSSREHLGSLLAASTRYSATTRPALAAFLVSLIASWPSQRESIINVVMYSSGGSGTERGGGLLRELYRGYVRSSALGRTLGVGSEKDKSGTAIVAALTNPQLAEDWPALVLLCELYSRCLLTLGDDEFYSAAKGANPLTIDEVVGFSGLLRNLAFALYWQETSLQLGASAPSDAADEAKSNGRLSTVAGTRMSVEGLRQLATTLLKQMHARE